MVRDQKIFCIVEDPGIWGHPCRLVLSQKAKNRLILDKLPNVHLYTSTHWAGIRSSSLPAKKSVLYLWTYRQTDAFPRTPFLMLRLVFRPLLFTIMCLVFWMLYLVFGTGKKGQQIREGVKKQIFNGQADCNG